MYGSIEQVVSRERRSDIRREVAAYRLEGRLRAGHGREPRSPGAPGQKPSWYAPLLGRRLRGPHGADYHQAAENGGGPVG